MRVYRVCPALLLLCALALSSCGRQPYFVAKDEPWRDEEERRCLAAGVVRESPFLTSRSSLGASESEYCGALKPFAMSGADLGRVSLRPPALLRCPMIPAVERWVRQVVEPAARRHLGQPVAELRVAASYSCRPVNGIAGGNLSEHGHANALDISTFILADGRAITVKQGWWGDLRERAFLRAVHGGACDIFSTVLGPLADSHHRDHFHLDLARHGRGGDARICR